jgi:N utilization substance protein B
MQALCQWEAQREKSLEGLRDFFAAQEASAGAAAYATELVQAFWAKRKRFDKMIAGATERWALSRISLVERNIMRVAVVELTQGEVPPKVALNEAIEIGRDFGGEDSPRFINGVLDRITKRITKDDA